MQGSVVCPQAAPSRACCAHVQEMLPSFPTRFRQQAQANHSAARKPSTRNGYLELEFLITRQRSFGMAVQPSRAAAITACLAGAAQQRHTPPQKEGVRRKQRGVPTPYAVNCPPEAAAAALMWAAVAAVIAAAVAAPAPAPVPAAEAAALQAAHPAHPAPACVCSWSQTPCACPPASACTRPARAWRLQEWWEGGGEAVRSKRLQRNSHAPALHRPPPGLPKGAPFPPLPIQQSFSESTRVTRVTRVSTSTGACESALERPVTRSPARSRIQVSTRRS